MKNKKNNNSISLKKILIVFLMTIASGIVFILKYPPVSGLYFQSSNEVYRLLTELKVSIVNFDVSLLFLTLFIAYFYYKVLDLENLKLREKIYLVVVALAFSCINIIGKNLSIDNSLRLLTSTNAQIVKSILFMIGYTCLNYGALLFIVHLIQMISNDKNSHGNNRKNDTKSRGAVKKFLSKHYIIISGLVILLLWIPRMIIYYPGVASGDTVDSLAQFFNIKSMCWSARAINLVNDNVIINKHHSVFFTMLLGIFVSLGKEIYSYKLGMFLFIIFQTILTLIAFLFLIKSMKKNNIPSLVIAFSVIFIGGSSIISSYVIAAIKDTIGACFVLIYNILLLSIIVDGDKFFKNITQQIFFAFSLLIILLIKSNSLFIVGVSSFSLLIYLSKKSREWMKKMIIVLLVPIGIFFVYDKVILPYFEVTGTNKKESYSIPFMQISRLAHNNETAITEEDQEIIDKVLSYSAVKNSYDPELADGVKNTFKKDATDEEFNDFWKVYFKYLKKYPRVYVAGFVNSTYAYIYPDAGETKGLLEIDYRIGEKTKFKLVNLTEFSDFRLIMECFDEIKTDLPIFSLFNHVAYYDWFLLLSMVLVIIKKRYKYLIPMMSLFAIFISSMISPVNGSFRYILAIVFCMPLILSIDLIMLKEKKR